MKNSKVGLRYGIAAALVLMASSATRAQGVASELQASSVQFANRIEASPRIASFRTLGEPFQGGELLSVVNAPFSGVGTMTYVYKFLDGNRITRKDTVTYYRDGQGRVRVERSMDTLSSGMPIPCLMFVNITDPISGKSLNLQPTERRCTTSFLRMHPRRHCNRP